MKVTRKNAKYTIGDPSVNKAGAASVQQAHEPQASANIEDFFSPPPQTK